MAILQGTSGNDIIDLAQSSMPDDANGNAGDDAISGNSKNNNLWGGPGSDAMYGGSGNDAIFGGDGADTLDGGDGQDIICGEQGGPYSQSISNMEDNIIGGNGNDIIIGGPGVNAVAGGFGDDVIYGAGGPDQLDGGPGNDIVFGYGGGDIINGGVGNDTLYAAGHGPDFVGASFGEPSVIHSDEGNDTVFGGGGADQLYGDSGNDFIHGLDGNDMIFGGDDADQLYGGSGSDIVHGGAGDDAVFGSDGDDTIWGDEGNDRIDGGTGVSTAAYAGASNGYTVVVGPGSTTVLDKIGLEGADTLTHIQKVRFADQTLNMSWFTEAATLPAEQFVSLTEMYIAYFNRAPDSIGLNYWASQFSEGMSLPQIAASFFVQPETIAQYPPGMSTQTFVAEVYQNVLGRSPDAAGLSYWMNQLDSGAVSKPIFILAIINGAQASTGNPADALYLSNKALVGTHFALANGLSNVTQAHAVMAVGFPNVD